MTSASGGSWRPGRDLRILDLDVEARATGYGDPDWVPQEITAVAWSWVGEDEVQCRLRLIGLRRMLAPLRQAWDEAEMVTGHNIRKFDLPLINSELLRAGLPGLTSKLSQDTLRDMVRTKGMKRDQDNLLKRFGLEEKLPLSWQDWQDAYEEKGWPVVADRVVGDVRGHKEMRREMVGRGWLRTPRPWSP